MAAEKERAHLAYWSAEQEAGAWHLLTGDEANIQRVTSAAGFSYRWDERTGQFAHVSGVLVVTPDGTLSRYFYGVEYSPKELRLALVESGEGKIGSAIDELLLYCFHYDPEAGQYGVVVMNLIRLGGVLTIGFIAGSILLMRRREARTAGRA
jgi:protein SCO1/2